MSATEYQTQIAAADTALVLHTLRISINSDTELHSTEKDDLCKAISARFGKLNASTTKPKARW